MKTGMIALNDRFSSGVNCIVLDGYNVSYSVTWQNRISRVILAS